MSSNLASKPPTGLHRSGRALWRDITGAYVLDAAEQRMLIEACRTADVIDALSAVIEADGVMSETGRKPHPAVPERRAQQITLGRLLNALRLPTASGVTPQRQVTFRKPQIVAESG